MTTQLWAVGLVAISSFMGAFGALFLKKGADKLTRNVLQVFKNWSLMLGVGIYVMSTLVFIMGLSGGELSVLYPIVSTGYAWTCLLSVKYLGEHMNSYRWWGIAFIVLGVALIGMGG